MNTYTCMYRGDEIEVSASTSYDAQTIAQAEFQKKHKRRKVRGHEIITMLVSKGGEVVTHSTQHL